jgi:hypothetical protein
VRNCGNLWWIMLTEAASSKDRDRRPALLASALGLTVAIAAAMLLLASGYVPLQMGHYVYFGPRSQAPRIPGEYRQVWGTRRYALYRYKPLPTGRRVTIRILRFDEPLLFPRW